MTNAAAMLPQGKIVVCWYPEVLGYIGKVFPSSQLFAWVAVNSVAHVVKRVLSLAFYYPGPISAERIVRETSTYRTQAANQPAIDANAESGSSPARE